MYRKILVATDLSAASEVTLETAFDLAYRLGASLRALHVTVSVHGGRQWFVPFSAPELKMAQQVTDRERAAEQQAFLDQIAKVRRGQPWPEPEILILEGEPSRVIVDHAESEDADLLVLGTHGRSGLGRVMLGSVAERVVRSAPCPVLIVRPRKGPGSAD